MNSPDRVMMPGSLRPIAAKRTSLPVPTFEERISPYTAKRQATRKAREQQRRDRLKDALDRLALVVPQQHSETCSNKSVSSHSSTDRDIAMKDSKLQIVESAIEYITRLKEEVPPRQFEGGHDYDSRKQVAV